MNSVIFGFLQDEKLDEIASNRPHRPPVLAAIQHLSIFACREAVADLDPVLFWNSLHLLDKPLMYIYVYIHIHTYIYIYVHMYVYVLYAIYTFLARSSGFASPFSFLSIVGLNPPFKLVNSLFLFNQI